MTSLAGKWVRYKRSQKIHKLKVLFVIYLSRKSETIWNGMEPAELDMPMIEYLFEHRSKDGNGGKDKSGGLVTSGNLRSGH